MLQRALLIAVLLFVPLGLCRAEFRKDFRAAQQTAERWLGLVDAGQLEAAWGQRYGLANARTTKAQWMKWMHTVRAPLGRVLSRTRYRDRFTHQINGAPDGDYELFSFQTSFEHKRSGYEVLTVARAGALWQVASYGIR